jgi:uncharacterized SAM-binding protein YcdF (DUF218 family)
MGLIEQLIFPIYQAALLVALGLLMLCRRRYRAGTLSVLFGILWLGCCSTPAFATWLREPLEQRYEQKEAAAYPHEDVIVVLGGGTLPGNNWMADDPHTQATRLGFGLQLFQHGRANVVLLSGGDQAVKMARMLLEQGVPATALRMENASANTHQNALYTAAMLRRENLLRILLVTSGIHMSRAAGSFERQGLTVIPAPAPDPIYPSWQHSRWWPQRAALQLSGRCLHEYLGMWWYQIHSWV